GVLGDREGRGGGRHCQHGNEREAGGDEAVDVEGSPERKVHHSDADGLQGIGEDLVAVGAETLAPDDHGDPGQQADGDASRGADPVVVESKLQEVGNTDQDGGDADPVQPVRADAGFEIGLILGRCGDWPRRNAGRRHALTLRWGCRYWNRWGWRGCKPRSRRSRDGGSLACLRLAFETVHSRDQIPYDLAKRMQIVLRRVHWTP